MNYLYRLGRLWTTLLFMLVLLACVALAALLVLTRLESLRVPKVVSIKPEHGARDLPVLTTLQLRFSEPMNHRSVEQALEVTPPSEFAWRWSADGTTAVLSPTAPLLPGQAYTVTLDTSAKSRLLRSIESPASSRFVTARAPAAQFFWPPDGGSMPADGAIAIQFSQPIVPEAEQSRSAALELRLTPHAASTTRWVNPSTVLIRPEEPLRLGQIYTATVEHLADIAGTPLAEPLRWQFRADPPQLLMTTPHQDERVSADQPLLLSFARPVDPAQISEALTLTPTVELRPAAAITPTKTITLTASQPLTAGLRYTATLRLGDSLSRQWSFVVRDTPQVLASVPGSGQSIAPSEDVRLLFSAEPDEELIRRSLSLTPEVPDLTTVLEGRELRIRGGFAPSTAYTLTLQTASRRAPFELHFRTLGDMPGVFFEQPEQPLSVWPAGALPELRLRWSQTPQPRFELFALSRPLLLQGLAEPERPLDPTRFELPPLRTWSASGGSSREQVTLADEAGEPLSPGVYLLRVSAGPFHAQRLLVISRYETLLETYGNTAVVWATQHSDGGPAAGLPLLALSNDTPLAAAQTDASGLWSAPINAAPGRLVVFGGQADDPAVAIGTLRAPGQPQPSGLLFADRPRYGPGATIQLVGAGFPPSTTVDLRLNDTFSIWSAQTNAAGMLSTTLELSPDMKPGSYVLQAGSFTELWAETHIAVVPHTSPLPELTLRVSNTLAIAAEPFTAWFRASRSRLPLLDEPVDWQLSRVLTASGRLEPVLSGTVRSDVAGVGTIDFTVPERQSPGRYLLQASLPGRTTAVVPLVVAPRLQLSLDPQSLLVQAGQQTELLVTARHADGSPAAGSSVRVVVEAMTGDREIERAERLQILRAATNAAGIARVVWTPPAAGRYRLRAGAGEEPEHAEVSVWATAPGFRGSPQSSDGALTLIADQASYAPGAVANILPLIPGDAMSTLLVVQGPDSVAAQVSTVAAGEPISVALPQRGPAQIEAFVPGEQSEGSGAAPGRRRGELVLPIQPAAGQLRVSLAVEPNPPRPGELATFSLALADSAGRPVSGTAALALHEAIEPGAPLSATRSVESARWIPSLSIGASGSVSITVRMPQQSTVWELRAIAQASGSSRADSASLLVASSEPIEQHVTLPQVLRVGDLVTGTVVLHGSRPISASLTAPDVQRVATSAIEPPRLASPVGGYASSSWGLRALEQGVSYVRAVAEQGSQRLSATVPITVEELLQPASYGSLGVADSGAAELIGLPALAGQKGRLVVSVASDLHELLASDWARLRERPAAGLVASAATVLDPSLPAEGRQAALDRLLSLQNGDGGWGWWRGTASDPYATGLAIRALVLSGQDAGNSLRAVFERTAIYLRARLARADTADTSALLLALLAEMGSGDADAIKALLADEQQLSRGSQALLALALAHIGSPDEGRLLLARLLSKPASGSDQSLLKHSAVRSQALIVLALARLDPSSSLIRDRAYSLLSLHRGSGWGTPYETLLALAALQELPRWVLPAGSTPRYQVKLNDKVALEDNKAGVLSYALAELPLTSTLTIESKQGSVYYAWWLELADRKPGEQLLVLREYLDPTSGEPLEDHSLSRGAELLVQLTLVTRKPLSLVELRESLPPGALLVNQPEGFGSWHSAPGALLFSAPTLSAGVHQLSFRLQLTMPGSFTVPGPYLSAVNSAEAVGPPMGLRVAP